MPQWVHHGERDDIIPISASVKMVDALTEAHAEGVRFSRYAEDAHDCWTRAYIDIEVWRWMLGRRRESGRREVGEVGEVGEDEGVVVPVGDKVAFT